VRIEKHPDGWLVILSEVNIPARPGYVAHCEVQTMLFDDLDAARRYVHQNQVATVAHVREIIREELQNWRSK
jgi:hypothetical protein